MEKILRRLARKKTWVRINYKGKEHAGEITMYKDGIVCLEYVYRDKSKVNMKLYLKSRLIDNVECLACENKDVWTS